MQREQKQVHDPKIQQVGEQSSHLGDPLIQYLLPGCASAVLTGCLLKPVRNPVNPQGLGDFLDAVSQALACF
jgi:hypothetical protein